MPGADEAPKSLDDLVARLAAEPDSRRRSALLSRQRWARPETVSKLYEETVRLARIDLRQAERLAKSASWLSRKMDDEASRALGFRALGHIHYLGGENLQAWRHYGQALVIYERLGMELETGRTLSGGMLQVLSYLGRYDEALAWAEKARDIFTRRGDRLRLARLDQNIANVLNRLDRFEEALALYRKAYAELIDIGGPQDVAIALRNMATCQIAMHAFNDALDTYDRVHAWCARHEMPLLVAEADYNIAYLYYLRGEYTRALELYAATREHCHTLEDHYHEGLCDLDQSEMYLELNLSEEGARLAERALGAFQRLNMGYEAAKALTNLAIARSHHGDAEAALAGFREAREWFTRENNRAWIAMVDLYRALVLFQDGRLEEARTLGAQAFGFFSGSPFLGKAALCRLLLARIDLNAGRAASARNACLDAIERAESAGSPALGYQAHFVMGLIEESLGAPEAAYQEFLRARDRLEGLRSQLHADEMKIAFLKDKLAVYESLVGLCLNRSAPGCAAETAFGFIEQAKSRSLADLIAFRAHHIPAARETRRVLVEQVGALRERLNAYTSSIRLLEGRPAGHRDGQLEKLRRSAGECERQLLEAISTARTEDPEYASLQGGGAIGIEQIRSAIPKDAALIQFYRVRDVFYACVVSEKGLKIAPLGSASELRRSLQLLRFQLSKFRLGADYVRVFQHKLLEAARFHLRDFYRQLIAPLLGGLDAEHLIVAPHEFLHYVPFQALCDNDGYLGDRFRISYTPSGSVYYLCSVKAPNESGGSLVMGVPDDAAPYILDEVRAVAAALPGAETLVGSEATHAALREKGPHSRIIHIATHGWFRQDNPMFSSINLGDSQLNLFDLYQLSLPAELVTLSGCGTGLNVVVGGDELLGLKRGLLYAGAQSLLLTLWDVNDKSTAEFMKLFYERLKAGADKARAVQEAMAAVRDAYPHPFYWAPFTLVGSNR